MGAFLSIFFVLGCIALSWADEPSKLLVVRGGGNTLWKMTCNGDDCSDWEQISGAFTQQPTLVWDVDLMCYYLYGVGEDGRIWSSTFDRFGDFNDDWVPLPGSSPSPIAAVGGGIDLNYKYVTKASDTAFSYGSMTDVMSGTITCPYDGYVLATVSGVMYIGLGPNIQSCLLYLVDSSGGSDDPNYQATASTQDDVFMVPFSHQRRFWVQSGRNLTVYVTGKKGWNNGTESIIQRPVLTLEYFPYSRP